MPTNEPLVADARPLLVTRDGLAELLRLDGRTEFTATSTSECEGDTKSIRSDLDEDLERGFLTQTE